MTTIVFAHDHFDYIGGGEQMLLRVRGLLPAGVRADAILAFAGDKGLLGREDGNAFGEVLLPGYPQRMSIGTWSEAFEADDKVRGFLKDREVAGIAAFSFRTALRLIPQARRRRVPLLWMCQQSFPLFEPPFRTLKALAGNERLRQEHVHIVCISDEAMERFRHLGIPEERLHLVRNGIDVERFGDVPAEGGAALREELGLSGCDLVVACVARLDPIKNQEVALAAVAEAKAAGVKVGLILVGGEAPHAPEYARELKAEAERLSIVDRVVSVGDQKDVRPYLAAADAALLPSVKEAAGLVLAEAGAAGLPLIGANVGGIPEIVRHGETGMLFDPANAKELAQHFAHLAGAPEERRQLGTRARDLVRSDFNKTRQDEKWSALLTKVFSLGKGPESTAKQQPADPAEASIQG